ncbi:MAG TPA: hypothetical protein VLE70_20130 [Anaerolineae bacterium]|nr:hypothetical protein [Anaerolineae bacterium]
MARATLTKTATETPTKTPTPTTEPTSESISTPVNVGSIYEDVALAFSMQLPEDWTGSHAHGTTTVLNAEGVPQMRVRSYLTRGGLYSAKTIAEKAAPPSERDVLTLTDTTIGSYPAKVSNTAVAFINVGGRYLAFEALSDNPIIPTLLETLNGDKTDLNDNYILMSSENWLAEVSGGANIAEAFTVQRRDGKAGYTLFTEPPTQGLGYDLAQPLFFTPDEQYLYFHHRGVADGCGLYFGGGDMVQVDLGNGTETILENTDGVGHTLAPDGHTVALLRGRLTNEFTITLYDLDSSETKTIVFPLAGPYAAAGDLIFSTDGRRIAFAAQQQTCGEGWTIGTVDLESAELTIHTVDAAPWFRPVAWEGDVITLQPTYTYDETIYLDVTTNEIVNERP